MGTGGGDGEVGVKLVLGDGRPVLALKEGGVDGRGVTVTLMLGLGRPEDTVSRVVKDDSLEEILKPEGVGLTPVRRGGDVIAGPVAVTVSVVSP